MAFKMKGSAFKLNDIATKSALKQYSDQENTATIVGETFTTPTYKGRDNPETNETQQGVLDNAYNVVTKAINAFNKAKEDGKPRNEVMALYDGVKVAKDNYAAVSVSLNTVNIDLNKQ